MYIINIRVNLLCKTSFKPNRAKILSYNNNNNSERANKYRHWHLVILYTATDKITTTKNAYSWYTFLQ